VALFDGLARSASAEVLEPVTALVMPRSVLEDLLRTDPAAAGALLGSAAALLRRLTSRSADMVFLDVEGRVAKLLVEVGERHGRSTASGTEVDLGISQSDIGRMVGGSRQTVNQIFRSFEARRFIQTSGRTVVITAAGALRRRAALPSAAP
jgi:CRP-like cAMP-binding protein